MKLRLVAYPVIVVATLALFAVSSYDFPRSARIASITIPRPAEEVRLSPDGRLLAAVGNNGAISILRIDGPSAEPLISATFLLGANVAERAETAIHFNTHCSHLLLHNAESFRVVDLTTKGTVEYQLAPPSPEMAADQAPRLSLDTGSLRPLPDDGGSLDSERDFIDPPNSSMGKLAAVALSSTARYVALRFDDGRRAALLETTAEGYAFRRWFDLPSAEPCSFVFAGDDSMVIVAYSGSYRRFALPSARPLPDCPSELKYQSGLRLTPDTATARFAGIDRDAHLCRYDAAENTVPRKCYGTTNDAGIGHLYSNGAGIVAPILDSDVHLDGFRLLPDGASETERFSLEHDSGFAHRTPLLYVGSGVSPEGRLLRVATRTNDTSRLTIDTFDLDLVAAQVESHRQSYSKRRQLAFAGGVALLCLVFEGGLFLASRRQEAESRRIRALLSACTDGDGAAAVQLIRGFAGRRRANHRTDLGFTPLLVAAGKGHAEIVAALLTAGADIEACDPAKQGTALTYACCVPNKDEATALLLLARGANVLARTTDGVTAAKLAAERGLAKVLAAIAAKDPGALAIANDEGVTPAYSAAEENHVDCLELCIKHVPASLEICRKEDHASPAYVAAFKGHDAALAALAAAAPATLRLPGPQGYLPATIAAQKGHTDCVRILAQHAPETFGTTVEGEKRITPAFLAAQNGHHETLAIIATVAPATLGQPRANDNVTPAYQAAFKGHTRCLEVIAEHAADSLLVRNAEKHLPAFVAAQNNHVDCIAVIQRFAPATLADSTEGSPAFIAAQLNQLDALRYLLKVAPESFDTLFSGNNPAHIAAAQCHEEAYALLASERPGLLTVENPAGKTPPQLLEAAHAERKAAEERNRKPVAPASDGRAGIVLWGIGFHPDQAMLHSALTTFAQGNMLRLVFLMGSPSETSRLDEKPSEIEAFMYYDRIARRNGWNTGERPRFQFLGLPDGRKLILATPPRI